MRTMMAVPIPPHVFLLMAILVSYCQCSPSLSDPSPASASSSSSSSSSSSAGHHPHRHRHRHHHHHHHHGEHQPTPAVREAVGKEDVRSADAAVGGAVPQRDGKAKGEDGGEGSSAPQRVRETTPSPGGSGTSRTTVSTSTTQSANPVKDMPAEAGPESGHHPPGPPRDRPQPVQGQRHRDIFERHPQDPPPTVLPSSGTPSLSTLNTTASAPRASSQLSVSDKQDDLLPVDSKAQQTTTERTVPDRPEGVLKDDDDEEEEDVVEDDAAPQAATLPKTTHAPPSDEKLVNRPRWLRQHKKEDDDDDDVDNDNDGDDDSKRNPEHSSIKDNSSRNRPRKNKDGVAAGRPERVSPVDPQPDQLPDAPPDRESSDADLRSNKSGLKANMEEEEKEEEEEGEAKKKKKKKQKQKPKIPVKGKQKEDAEDPAEAKKDVKGRKKWKSRKSKPLMKGCPGCTETERKMVEARELHKQVLKAQLLDKLRLVPTFRRQPWPPKLPDQVFAHQAQRDGGEDDDRYYAKPTQLLLFGRDLGPRHRLKKAGTGSYKFVVRGRVKGALQSARLWVYKMADANDAHEQTLVVTELHMSKRRRLRERSLVARLDTRVREGWVSFDVTQLVRRWMEDYREKKPASSSSSSPHGFYQQQHQLLAIRCKTCHRTNYRAIFGVKSHFRPVLEIRETEERQTHRQQRSACDPSNGCCKFDLVVSFEELGIHEIFRPLTIKADYCYGTCERPDASHYNHTRIMQRMRFNSHVGNVTLRQRLQPCCVPVVLREATIFHYLNSGLDSQVSLVPNLLVDRCGCA